MSGPIGVLGGVFDPVHNGHLSVAVLAREFFKLENILFIPSGNPPHKHSTVFASAEDRLAMLQLALKDEPGAIIWDNELHRCGFSYTVDTLHELRVQFQCPVFFIMGSDNLKEIVTWKNYKQIFHLATVCVAHRPGYSISKPAIFCDTLHYLKFPSPEWGISSTLIRNYLQKGFSCRHLIPSRVIEYIYDNNLYGTAHGKEV